MSDTRFIILGVGLIFTGIIVLSVFGAQVDEITLQEEFRECYEYHVDAPPTEIDCDIAFQNKMNHFFDCCIADYMWHCFISKRNKR